MSWNLYLRNGTVYVPTVAETEAGYYLDIEPVEVAPAADMEAVRSAIKRAIARGNPRVPTPTRSTFPKPVVLRYANLKSWAAFERDCLFWMIEQEGGRYKIKQGRRLPAGGWEEDPTQVEELAPGADVNEVARRAAASVHMTLGIT